MLGINMDDVVKVLTSMKNELIILGVALALAVVITIALAFAKNMRKPVKKLAHGNVWLAFVLVAVIVINLILTGPMYTMINLATGRGSITEESMFLSIFPWATDTVTSSSRSISFRAVRSISSIRLCR